MGTYSEEAALPFQCSLPFTIDINNYESKFFPVNSLEKRGYPRKSRKLFPSVKTAADHGKKTVQSPPPPPPPAQIVLINLMIGKKTGVLAEGV